MRSILVLLALIAASVSAAAQDAPSFRPDPFWPKPLPGNLILGQVAGIAVDRNDHVWIVHRPTHAGRRREGRNAEPARDALLHRRAAGDGVRPRRQSAAAPGAGPAKATTGRKNEHGIYVDKDGNVWVAGNGKEDHQILKFTPDGKFLMQIGKPGSREGIEQQTQLGRPRTWSTDDAAGELYVADGYLNRRVVVFDAKTGAYKRHWGAYGTKAPTDDKLPPYKPGDHRCRRASPTPCTACACRATTSSTSATAPTTASRCSARTVPS